LVTQIVDGGNVSIGGIRVGPRIGKGNFGEVFKAYWRGTEVALKKFPVQNLTDQLLRDFEKEVLLMR
jgi:predicted Ser/Thr protein kinase